MVALTGILPAPRLSFKAEYDVFAHNAIHRHPMAASARL
jgi:hypothetical protein